MLKCHVRSKGGGYSCGSNGYLIFCGALPVVLVFFLFFSFFSSNIEAGAPGKQERIRPDVVRAGVAAVVVVCFIVVFGGIWSYSFSSFSFCNIKVGNEEWDLALYERVLYKQFVPSQLTPMHDVCLTFAVD